MGKVTFSRKWGGVKVQRKPVAPPAEASKSVEDLVREMKKKKKSLAAEEYRERSLALNGLICARCGREFTEANRHLLTVHHKDGNHQNNPPDGSNWENLCVYCHEDVHSRETLAESLAPEAKGRDVSVVFEDATAKLGSCLLADKLQKALQKKAK
jgi:5-methylcytosine-specific restriction endonuclease McrA